MSLSYSNISTDAENSCDKFHIAKVVDDNRNTMAIVYYSSASKDCRKELEPEELEVHINDIVDDACETLHMQDIPTKKLLQVESDIIAKERPPGRYEQRIYDHAMKILEARESKYFHVASGFKLEVIPRHIMNQEDRLYVAGPSGGGKSWFSSLYARNYKVQYPGNGVYLFSEKEYDPVFDGTVPDLVRVPLNRALVTNLKRENRDLLEQYKCSLLIFDDFDGVQDVTIRTTVQHFKNSMLRLGRQNHISTISITHKLLSGMKSQVEMQEATHFVFFPSKNLAEVKKMLKTYCGLEKPEVGKILDEEAKQERWMCLIRPDIFVTEKFIKIVK